MNSNKPILKKAADCLSKGSNRLTSFQQKLLLIICLLPIALYCTYLSMGNGNDLLRMSSIEMPLIPAGRSNEQLKREIQSINNYVDSLKETKDGMHTLDSMQRVRPGLIDSITIWKNRLH